MKSKITITSKEFLRRIVSAVEDDDKEALCTIISDPAFEQYSERLLGKALARSSQLFKVNATQYLLDQNKPVEGSPKDSSPLILAVQGQQDPDPWTGQWVKSLTKEDERCRMTIIEMLLKHRADTEALDEEGKTALMIALSQKHQSIVDILINHGANINVIDHLQRNALHIIAADDGFSPQEWHSTVELLLQNQIHTSGLQAQDQSRRTPLHWACVLGKLALAEQLINASSLEDRDGVSETALHLAASQGTPEMVNLLISHNASLNARSDGGWTPLHMACDGGHTDSVQILLNSGADVNAILLNKVSSLHLAAQGGHLEVVRLLLAHNDFKQPEKDIFNKTAFMRAAQNYHSDIVRILDPTNLSDSVSGDIIGACKGFDAAVVDFGDYRHNIRERKMTVFELLHQRNPTNPEWPAFSIVPEDKKQSFTWVHFPVNNISWIETLFTKWFIENDCHDLERYQTLLDSLAQQQEGDYAYSHFMRPSSKFLCRLTDSLSSTGKKSKSQASSIFALMPYIHFETAHKLREMKEAIERKEAGNNNMRPRTCDEMLIRAYLNSSTSSLNIRRTLDESFNSNIKTSARNEDQVVFEHQGRATNLPLSSKLFDPKIVMVDQLWIWVIGSNLVFTSFPQRWQQPKNDEFNIIDEIKEKLKSQVATPGITAYDLALIITDCAIDAVNGMGFWNAYNSYISHLKEDQTSLYKQFNADSLGASTWLKYQKGSKGMDWHEIELRGPSYIDSLLEIRSETALLSRVQKIREELMMFTRILEDQLLVLPDFEKSIYDNTHYSQRGTKKALEGQIKPIKSRVRDMDRMDKQAEREKREKTVLVFTIVTIVFLPLSFIASFFTINIAEFPKDPEGLPLAYVSKYMFGIGFAVAVPLILVAMSLDDIWGFFRAARQKLVKQDSEVINKRISMESDLTDLRFRTRRRGDVETALESLPVDVDSKSSSISY